MFCHPSKIIAVTLAKLVVQSCIYASYGSNRSADKLCRVSLMVALSLRLSCAMRTHPQSQRDGQAAGAAAAVADGRARDAALVVQPGQHLVHRLRVPLPDVQLHLRATSWTETTRGLTAWARPAPVHGPVYHPA